MCRCEKYMYHTCPSIRSVSLFTFSSLISLSLPLKRLTKFTFLYSPINTLLVWYRALQKRKRCNRAMFLMHFCTSLAHFCSHTRLPALSVGLDRLQVKPDKHAIHVDCMMSGFRSMRFEHECIACLSLESVWVWNFFKKSNLKLVYFIRWSYDLMLCKQCVDYFGKILTIQ